MSYHYIDIPGSTASFETMYFFWLPKMNCVLFANEPKSEVMCQRYYGSLSSFLSSHGQNICIPLPAELVIAVGWESMETVAANYGLSESQLAALALVKGMP